jgi:hypothetical protein
MTRYFAAAALFLAIVPAAWAQNQGTPEQQRACRPDVARFCRHMQSGGDYAIENCLRANIQRLRPACRDVLEGRR